jgi:hypothetical protein
VSTNALIAPASTGPIGRGAESRQFPVASSTEDGPAFRGCVGAAGSSTSAAAGTASAVAIWCSCWTEIPVSPFSMALIVAGLTPTRAASPLTETPRAARRWPTPSPVFGVAATGTDTFFMVFRIPKRHKGACELRISAATLTKLTMGVTVVSNPLWITERALCLFR